VFGDLTREDVQKTKDKVPSIGGIPLDLKACIQVDIASIGWTVDEFQAIRRGSGQIRGVLKASR